MPCGTVVAVLPILLLSAFRCSPLLKMKRDGWRKVEQWGGIFDNSAVDTAKPASKPVRNGPSCKVIGVKGAVES